ncbi:MAG: DUF4251 domain-containing protein [Maribacter sp.]|nr:DUF4251 domain-containing protein [Maribacter sp.]
MGKPKIIRKLSSKNGNGQEQTEALVSSNSFVFVARTTLPSNGRRKNLASDPNFVKFEPEFKGGNMSFFGRACSRLRHDDRPGLIFKEEPEVFTAV